MPSPRDREDAQKAAQRFLENSDRGDDPSNDDLVVELDPRPDPRAERRS